MSVSNTIKGGKHTATVTTDRYGATTIAVTPLTTFKCHTHGNRLMRRPTSDRMEFTFSNMRFALKENGRDFFSQEMIDAALDFLNSNRNQIQHMMNSHGNSRVQRSR